MLRIRILLKKLFTNSILDHWEEQSKKNVKEWHSGARQIYDRSEKSSICFEYIARVDRHIQTPSSLNDHPESLMNSHPWNAPTI
jgi:hypothetical protein